MEENYRLEKEYKIPYDTFKEAYTQFQKKSVYPRSYLFMGLFIVIAVIYIIAAVKDPTNKLAYVLIFLSFALAVREWYNPKKIRRSILETIKSENLEDEVYKICIGDEWVDISTLPHENVENFTSDSEYNDNVQEENLPETSRIPINGDLYVQEYENFFLLHVRKSMFYVVPKENFSTDELEIVRSIQHINK